MTTKLKSEIPGNNPKNVSEKSPTKIEYKNNLSIRLISGLRTMNSSFNSLKMATSISSSESGNLRSKFDEFLADFENFVKFIFYVLKKQNENRTIAGYYEELRQFSENINQFDLFLKDFSTAKKTFAINDLELAFIDLCKESMAFIKELEKSKS